MPDSANFRTLKLAGLRLRRGATHTVTAKVVGPDDVRARPRDPERHRADADADLDGQGRANTPGAAETPTITGGTQNDRAVGRNDVIFVNTNHPADGSVPAVAWKLDGTTVPNVNDGRSSTSPTST